MELAAGSPVVVIDAFGRDQQRIALGGVVPGGDFDVVWVCRPDDWQAARVEGREPEGVPWPAEDVHLAGDSIDA